MILRRIIRRRSRAPIPALLLGVTLVSGPLGAAGIAVGELFVGVWSPFATRWAAEAPVCVWSAFAGESFHVVASGADPDAFAMGAGAGTTIPYRLWWHRRNGPGQHEELRPGQPSRRAIRAHGSPDCGGGANARLRVRVRRADVDAAPAGIYRDTLLVTLVPL